jgi:putative transposase
MNNPHISIRQLEPVLGFSRQGYYQYRQRQAARPDHDAQVVSLVRQVRKEHPKRGGRKLYDVLAEQLDKAGIHLGRDALFTVLSANGLLVRRRRRRVTTTFSRHRFRKYRSGRPSQPD